MMTERKKAVTAERYHQIRRLVAIIYYKNNIRTMPILPMGLMNGYPNIAIDTFSGASLKLFNDRDVLSELVGDIDGCTLCNKEGNQYIVLYNENNIVKARNRLNWTLAHEFGHIALNHRLSTVESLPYDAESPDDEHALQEAEADYFAAMLLAYPAVVKACNICDIDDMVAVCGLSKQAATFRLSGIFRSQMQHSQFDEYVLRSFHDYIHTKHCVFCRAEIVSEHKTFCPYCGHAMQRGKHPYEGFITKKVPLIVNDERISCKTCFEKVSRLDPAPVKYQPAFCAKCGADYKRWPVVDGDEAENGMTAGVW